jgi:hypothetical protein
MEDVAFIYYQSLVAYLQYTIIEVYIWNAKSCVDIKTIGWRAFMFGLEVSGVL